MARKTAAEKAAEEAISAEVARRATEKLRLMWAGIFLAAVAMFAGGYLLGTAGDDGTLVGSDIAVAQSSIAQGQTGAQARLPGTGGGQGQSGMRGHVPRGSQGQGPGGGMGVADGVGQSGGIGFGAGIGMGPGKGPDFTGTPGGGNIDRIPGEGPYGLNFPGECPFGIYQPEDGVEIPVLDPGYLGIGVRQAADGVLVVEVVADSPGSDAGFEVEDVIVSFDGTKVATVGQFAQVVRLAGAGSVVEIIVLRMGTEITLQAFLTDIPS